MTPFDAVNDDEQFTLLLARYSEAENKDNPLDDHALSPALRQRLQRAVDCVRRLRRSQPAPPSDEARTLVLPGDTTLHDGMITGQVGRFHIRRTLGAGGGGIVFLAYDPQLRREVALKIPRLEALLTPELRQRFVRETQAAARFDHPNLVPIHEVGEADGVCFLVSAYCRGGSLADWLKQRTTSVPIRLAAELVADLAEAVQHVHEHGVYHRDIKPGNILLDPGVGHSRGESLPTRSASRLPSSTDELNFSPRLTDFGLAKLREGQTELTRSGAVMGTPSYMAPEQVAGQGREIGPTTDVYGLGAVLYEVLTGRPPFRGVTDAETLRQVLDEEPKPLRRLRPQVPHDLEIICLKCLEKEPSRRYGTAAELADDLHRFLAHEPIRARPVRRIERLRKWVRRRPAKAMGCATGLLLIAGLIFGEIRLAGRRQAHDADRAWAAKQDEEHRTRHRHNESRLSQLLYAENIALAWRALNEQRRADMAELLERNPPAPGAEDPRGFEWHYLARLSRNPPRVLRYHEILSCLVFSPDGMTCASGHRNGAIVLWDPVSGRERDTLIGHKLDVYAVAYSPDGKYLASGSGRSENGGCRGELLLWDMATRQLLHAFPDFEGAIDSVAFSPDGRTLAATVNPGGSGSGEVRMWAMPSRQLQARIPFAEGKAVTLAFLSTSDTLAAGCVDGKTFLCDRNTGKKLKSYTDHSRCVWSVACGRKQNVMVSGGHDGAVRLHSLESDRMLIVEYRHANEVWGVALSPDERYIASLCRDGVVKVWDRVHQCECFSRSLEGFGRAVAFSPDGKTLAVGIMDGRIWMCPLSLPENALSWLGHREGNEPREAWAAVFSPDSKMLASAGDDNLIRLWDPNTGCERAILRGHRAMVSSIALSPDGKLLASGSFDEQENIKLWNVATGSEIATLPGHDKAVESVVFSPDGKYLATSGRDRIVRLWDVATRKNQQILSGHWVESMAFSPDGRTLALASNTPAVFLWDLEAKKVRWTLTTHPRGHVAAAFSPDGKTLVTGDEKGTIRFFDAATGELRLSQQHHTAEIHCLAFTPDGKTVASAGFDKQVKLWQTATGRELLTFSDYADRVRWVTFSADGTMLATAGHDGILKIYRTNAATVHSPLPSVGNVLSLRQ